MWEKLEENNSPFYLRTERLKVPGGWLIRSFYTATYSSVMNHLFIKDENHSWKLKEE